MNYPYNIPLISYQYHTVRIVLILKFFIQHQEIVKFLEKKIAPYIADDIYSYVFGEKFVKLKNKVIDHLKKHSRQKEVKDLLNI